MSKFLDINLAENSVKDNLFIDEDVDLFFQELGILFQSKPTDTYGYDGTDFPNIKQYVFSRWVSNYQIKTGIIKSVSENCYHATSFKWDVEVNLLKDNFGKDILHLIFSVNLIGAATQNRGEKQFLIGS